jgi:hypothetical protein
LWTLVSFAASYGEYVSLRHALEAGRYSVVEGEVTDFNPMPRNGKGYESFVVSGKRFIFSDSELTAGFNQTTSHGSPIHVGAYVRIAYIGDTVVRLEMAK